MKRVLKYVFERKRAYNGLPLFEWMRDDQISPRERLAFYPAMAPFILSFGDLNRFVLRNETEVDEYQRLVNEHTFEDDHHWPWYLEDFSKLGFDDSAFGTSWMRFLWGEETLQNRMLMAKLTALIEPASGLERLVIVEAIEETGNVLFATMLPLAERVEQELGVQLRYCGNHHFELESGHAFGADHKILASVEVPERLQGRYKGLVDSVFDAFEPWTHELHRYALAHPLAPTASFREPMSGSRSLEIVAPGTGVSGTWELLLQGRSKTG